MQIQDLDTLDWMNVDSTALDKSSGYAIRGAGRPYATAVASGIAISGAKSNAFTAEYRAYYQASAAAAAATGAATTVNGSAAVFVQVSISY